MVHVDYREIFAETAILRVKIGLWVIKIKYINVIDLDQTKTHRQSTLHYNTIPKQFPTPTDKVTPHKDVSPLPQPQHKAPTKTAVRQIKSNFLKHNKRLLHDLVD